MRAPTNDRYCQGVEYSEVIRKRRMVRHYTGQPLADDVIERVLNSALRAPSAGFAQGWAFLVLTEKQDRARFWPFAPATAERTPTMQDAPLVVVPLAHKQAYLERYAQPDKGWEDQAESRWPAPYWFVDTGMAALMMLLTAVDEGLGACFIGIQPDYLEPFKREFGIPEPYAPIGAITIGYRVPDAPVMGSAVDRPRKDPASVIHRGQWQG